MLVVIDHQDPLARAARRGGREGLFERVSWDAGVLDRADHATQPVLDRLLQLPLVFAGGKAVHRCIPLVERNPVARDALGSPLGRDELHEQALIAWPASVGIAQVEAGRRVHENGSGLPRRPH
ncbi:MAG: hypothetical protein DMG24_21295 [Acidobacteria bacterium]|nr:MAG: hypothetical protein DMG24_21295 [Acidobacteriota bacterium]